MVIDTYEIEKNGFLDTKLLDILERNIHEAPNAKNYIHIIFVCWYLIIDYPLINHSIPQALLKEKLVHYFRQSIGKFEYDDHSYLFFVGWGLRISPWYFDVTHDYMGECFLWRAYHLNSSNALYKLTLCSLMKLSQKEIDELKNRIDLSQFDFDGLGFLLRDYFERNFKKGRFYTIST